MMREDSVVVNGSSMELSDSLNNVFLDDASTTIDLFGQTDHGLLSMEESSSEAGNRCWSQAAGSFSDNSSQYAETERLRELEEEQERLTNSLLSLSSHFAQVQFRLKQINEATGPDKDKLLNDLHDFAFRGCTDVAEFKRQLSLNHIEATTQEDAMKQRKDKQTELIGQLRDQLRDLETFAYQSGDAGLPSNEVMLRQKAVLDKLHHKLQLNLELDTMSNSELQSHIDDAIKQLDVPLKAKDQLVDQLQTQIVDLERFVNFLQAETGSEAKPPLSISSINTVRSRKPNPLLSLVGCQSRRFERNELKNTPKGNHYGDQRAHLELAVVEVAEVMEKYSLLNIIPEEKAHLSGERKEQEIFERSEEEIVTVVRKKLCPSLRALLEHGMHQATKPITSRSYMPFGCVSMRNKGQLIESVLQLRPPALRYPSRTSGTWSCIITTQRTAESSATLPCGNFRKVSTWKPSEDGRSLRSRCFCPP
ncbi:hypothetical protein L596_003321 [Steinernema carpocapsae]|uniref:RUN domain-containing protein n=1 Tax=Steinernema carpocapsae TaxID=34508 RepID=A0A4U8UW61_STECR|nr:hypothetical protein L596_003321 [Steinernema carpocapsae]